MFRFSRCTAALALGAAALLPALAAAQSSPPLDRGFLSGFFTANQPSATAVYTPADSYNSKGLANTVERLGRGRYLVTFEGLGDPTLQFKGSIAVTATPGTDAAGEFVPTVCNLGSYSGHSTAEPGGLSSAQAAVNCYDLAGNRKDATFTAAWGVPVGPGNAFTAVIADQPRTRVYNPARSLQFSHANVGHNAVVRRTARGRYEVRMPLSGGYARPTLGSVAVTAVNGGPVRCNVVDWVENAEHLVSTRVACFNAAGAATDSAFVMQLVDGQNLMGTNVLNTAYFWADQPETASYAPNGLYAYNNLSPDSSSPAIQGGRTSPGKYRFQILGQGNGTIGGSVTVTTYGAGNGVCNLFQGFPNGPGEQFVDVFCFDAAGAPQDNLFVVNLAFSQ